MELFNFVKTVFKDPPENVIIDPAVAGTEIDDTYFPYVKVTLQENYIHSRQLRYFLTAMGKAYNRAVKEKKRIVLVLDTRKLSYAKWNFIYELAKWFLSVRETTARYVLCTIILSENESFRNFVKNRLFKFVKKTRPNHICETMEEAWIWLILYLHSQAQAGRLYRRMNYLDDECE